MHAQATRTLLTALSRRSAYYIQSLASGLASVTGKMHPQQAAQICGEAATVVANSFAKETNSNSASSLAAALASLTERMDPAQATQVSDRVARSLSERLAGEKDDNTRIPLVYALSTLADRMEPPRGARTLERALQREVEMEIIRPTESSPGMMGMTGGVNLQTLSQHLATQSARLQPAEAKEICGSAAYALAAALEHATKEESLSNLALALADVAPTLGPSESSRLCERAINILWRARAGRAHNVALSKSIDAKMASLLCHVDPETAHHRARNSPPRSSPSGLINQGCRMAG